MDTHPTCTLRSYCHPIQPDRITKAQPAEPKPALSEELSQLNDLAFYNTSSAEWPAALYSSEYADVSLAVRYSLWAMAECQRGLHARALAAIRLGTPSTHSNAAYLWALGSGSRTAGPTSLDTLIDNIEEANRLMDTEIRPTTEINRLLTKVFCYTQLLIHDSPDEADQDRPMDDTKPRSPAEASNVAGVEAAAKFARLERGLIRMTELNQRLIDTFHLLSTTRDDSHRPVEGHTA